MKKTRIFPAVTALVMSAAFASAWPVHAEDDEITVYGDIRYSKSLNRELGIYAGDTFDYSNVTLEAVQYDWEGRASYVYSFTVGSGEFAELYTLDTSGVDTETPGDYEVIIKPAAGETGSFPYKSISPVRYYDLCMKGTESAIPVKVYPKDYNANTPLYLRCYTEYITMYCDGGVMIPLVGAYPAKVEYAVEDETIAKVQASSEPDHLTLWGLKEGETTVTVRTSDGRTTTEKVRVLPAIVTETEPPILTTTARFNPELTATTTTVTVTTPDPATTTTKWWYQYETTEPVPETTIACSTVLTADGTTTTTTTEITDIAVIREMLTNYVTEHNLDAKIVSNKEYPGYQDIVVEYNTGAEVNAWTELRQYIQEQNIDAWKIGVVPVVDGVPMTTSNLTVNPPLETGNVNCTDGVDVADAVLLARFVAEEPDAVITAQGKQNADANSDGNLTNDDVIVILKMIAKLI